MSSQPVSNMTIAKWHQKLQSPETKFATDVLNSAASLGKMIAVAGCIAFISYIVAGVVSHVHPDVLHRLAEYSTSIHLPAALVGVALLGVATLLKNKKLSESQATTLFEKIKGVKHSLEKIDPSLAQEVEMDEKKKESL